MKDRGLIYLCKMYAKIGMGAAGGGGGGGRRRGGEAAYLY